MQIIFSNNVSVSLTLDLSTLATVYSKIYKHLQHVTIPFREWDNPFYHNNLLHEHKVEQLMICASKLKIEIDKEQCLKQNQDYFNEMHKVYEMNYKGDPNWLDFHEWIHLCEKKSSTANQNQNFLTINYREKSGRLERTFDKQWFKYATPQVCAGDVFVCWSELGKTPYTYWKDGEPDDQNRLQQLSKPWLVLKPKILIALEDIDFLQGIDIDKFEFWWKFRHQTWCKHWNIDSWTVRDIFSVVPFGKVNHFKEIETQLKNNQIPVKVSI